MYKVKFELVNGGGNMFRHQEEFQVVGTGQYDWYSEEFFRDNLTVTEEITVKSSRPFTVVKTTRKYTDNNEKAVKEISQEVVTPENNSYFKYL